MSGDDLARFACFIVGMSTVFAGGTYTGMFWETWSTRDRRIVWLLTSFGAWVAFLPVVTS